MVNTKAAKTMSLLRSALNESGSDPALSEARAHIRQALIKLEKVSQEKPPRQIAQQWWDHIVAGVAVAPTSPQAAMRSLKDLDAMISAEQKKINALEKAAQPQQPSLLKD